MTRDEPRYSALITSAKAVMYSPVSVRLFDQDYANSFRAIFMKLCMIMDNCREKNPLNFGLLMLIYMAEWQPFLSIFVIYFTYEVTM